MIQFYETENGLDLIFPIVGTDGELITDTPEPGWPKLYVKGAPGSPFDLLPVEDSPGSYHHLVIVGEFTLLPGEVTHYFECYIDWRGSGHIILSDAFPIAVTKAPALSLE